MSELLDTADDLDRITTEVDLTTPFFRPVRHFVDWLVGFVGDRILLEVGCGCGALLGRLVKEGVAAYGVDPWAYEKIRDRLLLACVMPKGIEQCYALLDRPDLVILVCRPNHSGWVEEAVRHCHRRATFLYVGLDRNLEIDLPGFLLEEMTRGVAVGEEGEKVWRVHKRWETDCDD